MTPKDVQVLVPGTVLLGDAVEGNQGCRWD